MKTPSLLLRVVSAQALVMAAIYVLAAGWMAFTMLANGHGEVDRRMLFFAQRLAAAASADSVDTAALKSRMAVVEKTFVDGFAVMDGTPGYEPVYQIWGKGGVLLHRTAGAPTTPIADAPGRFGMAQFGAAWWQTVAVDSGDGRLQVHMAERWRDRLLVQSLLVRDIGLIQLLALALSAAAIWWAAERAFRPLAGLAAQLSRRTAGDLQQLPAERLYRETAPIVHELNALLAREAERLHHERRLLADVAHELRTPLAAIGTLAHLVLTADDTAARREASTALRQGIDRVAHLLAQLLSQARADSTLRSAALQPVDLGALVQERLAQAAVLARARGTELSFDAPPGLVVELDAGAMISLVDNLVDNAIRYTPGGGHVAVSLCRTAPDALALTVRDDGPGIAADELQRVFEAFYRVPGTQPEGSGLGLAIVQRVAQAHGASVGFVEGLNGRGIGVQVLLKRRVGRSGVAVA